MTVRELIEALQKLPPEADVYVWEAGDESFHDSERDPFVSFREVKAFRREGAEAYPHGRVKL